MIKKLIRKLFGQDAASADDTLSAASVDGNANDKPPARGKSASGTAARPRRKSTAAAAAQAPREPDVPVIIPHDVHGIDPTLISRNAIRVTEGLQQAGFRAFIVGGAVRDLLLGVKPKDFDVATDATPEQVQKLFRPRAHHRPALPDRARAVRPGNHRDLDVPRAGRSARGRRGAAEAS
ncbi:hypothetical protein QFZ99_002589 [Paraburkholderia atlantica]